MWGLTIFTIIDVFYLLSLYQKQKRFHPFCDGYRSKVSPVFLCHDSCSVNFCFTLSSDGFYPLSLDHLSWKEWKLITCADTKKKKKPIETKAKTHSWGIALSRVYSLFGIGFWHCETRLFSTFFRPQKGCRSLHWLARLLLVINFTQNGQSFLLSSFSA